MNHSNDTLYQAQKNRLRKAICSRVYGLTDKPGAHAALFRSLYSELNQRYKVSSYQLIKQKDLEDALKFVSKWGR